MSQEPQRARTKLSLIVELCLWTLMLGLGVFEIGWQPWRVSGIVGFSIWMQVVVSLMSIGKAVWNLRTGDR